MTVKVAPGSQTDQERPLRSAPALPSAGARNVIQAFGTAKAVLARGAAARQGRGRNERDERPHQRAGLSAWASPPRVTRGFVPRRFARSRGSKERLVEGHGGPRPTPLASVGSTAQTMAMVARTAGLLLLVVAVLSCSTPATSPPGTPSSSATAGAPPPIAARTPEEVREGTLEVSKGNPALAGALLPHDVVKRPSVTTGGRCPRQARPGAQHAARPPLRPAGAVPRVGRDPHLRADAARARRHVEVGGGVAAVARTRARTAASPAVVRGAQGRCRISRLAITAPNPAHTTGPARRSARASRS
jgi:hypothetical protein